MNSILCINLPTDIISNLKFKYPDFYAKCHFQDKITNSKSFALIVLPVEQFIYLNRGLKNTTVIAYGDTNHLEEAYHLGASDYLKDPWSIIELILRTEKILHFTHIQIGNNSIELLDSGICINHKMNKLSKREVKILSILFSNINQIVPYGAIAGFINIHSDSYENSLYVSIFKLRKKLNQFAPDIFPSLLKIENYSGSGYKLEFTCG